MTSLRSALFAGHVVHQRTRPKRHRLRYSVFYLALDLEEAPIVGRALRLFSVNRFNIFSFHDPITATGRAGLFWTKFERSCTLRSSTLKAQLFS